MAKTPSRKFKKHAACIVRVINEDVDPSTLTSLDRVHSEVTLIFFRRSREPFVEVGVLSESHTFIFRLEMAEVPKNL